MKDVFDRDLRHVRILQDKPKFVGLDKEIYGRYNKGDYERLPKNIARLLVQEGTAEMVG